MSQICIFSTNSSINSIFYNENSSGISNLGNKTSLPNCIFQFYPRFPLNSKSLQASQ
jgi:hypothetical protein